MLHLLRKLKILILEKSWISWNLLMSVNLRYETNWRSLSFSPLTAWNSRLTRLVNSWGQLFTDCGMTLLTLILIYVLDGFLMGVTNCLDEIDAVNKQIETLQLQVLYYLQQINDSSASTIKDPSAHNMFTMWDFGWDANYPCSNPDSKF